MPVVVTASDRLQRGQACYKSSNLVEASHHFKSVAKSCSCQAGKPNLECICVNFAAACKDRTLDGALRTPCKCPRRAQKRCKDESHLTALGSLVMVAVKAKDYKLGLIYAQNFVYLAPRDPRGYLRVGQVLRLMDKQHTALSVYQQGIGLVARANPDHSGIQALKEQEKITSKLLSQVDPLEALPAELLVLILSYLKTRQHCRCLRLSKAWKSFMVSQVARPLWTSQHFDQISKAPPKTIKPHTVQKYLAKYPGGQLQSLRIDNCAVIPIVRSKFIPILRVCPQLQHLSLGGACVIETGDLPALAKMPKLRTLSFDPLVIFHMQLLEHMIKAAHATLEELNILKLPHSEGGHPEQVNLNNWPQLPKLHTLRLGGRGKSCHVDMEHIIHLTPNVQTLWLDTMMYSAAHIAAADEIRDNLRWPKLQRIFIGPDVLFGEEDVCFPRLTESITELVLGETSLTQLLALGPGLDNSTSVQLFHNGFGNFRWARMPCWNFPNLERLVVRGRHSLTPEAVYSLIRPPIQNGKLRHLDLHPFPWVMLSPDTFGNGFRDEDATCVTALGVNCLIGEVGRYIYNADEALLELVGCFPNLADLDIGAETVTPHTIGRILEGGVHNIYHTQGASMLELKSWAQSKGKDVILGTYYDTSSPAHTAK